MNITKKINNYIDLLVLQEQSSDDLSTREQLIEADINYQKELSTYSFQEQLTILNQMKLKYEELQRRVLALKTKKAVNSLNPENELGIIDKSYNEFIEKLEEVELYLEKMNLVIKNLENKLLRQFTNEQIQANNLEQDKLLAR